MPEMSARDITTNFTLATHAAQQGPVIITESGVPTYVLLSFDRYRKLNDENMSLADALSLPPDQADTGDDELNESVTRFRTEAPEL